MPTVLIDGIEYVPRAEVPELTDERLKAALKEKNPEWPMAVWDNAV